MICPDCLRGDGHWPVCVRFKERQRCLGCGYTQAELEGRPEWGVFGCENGYEGTSHAFVEVDENGFPYPAPPAKGREPRGGCPCLYTTPCDPDCTCVNWPMSRGCERCCTYGSLEQREAQAKELAERFRFSNTRRRCESETTTGVADDDLVPRTYRCLLVSGHQGNHVSNPSLCWTDEGADDRPGPRTPDEQFLTYVASYVDEWRGGDGAWHAAGHIRALLRDQVCGGCVDRDGEIAKLRVQAGNERDRVSQRDCAIETFVRIQDGWLLANPEASNAVPKDWADAYKELVALARYGTPLRTSK